MRTACLIVLLLLVTATTAIAENGHPAGRLDSPNGTPFLLRSTEVTAEVAAVAARVWVRQTFLSPFRNPIEGIYSFPLPNGAAVDHVRIEIGGRVITAEIREAGRAEERYRRAAAAGQTASLTTQVRPNLFSQRITNLLPGEPVTVEISYVEDLSWEDGRYRFVYPVVAAPRYAGGRGIPAGLRGEYRKNGAAALHEFSLAVAIDSGIPIRDLHSPSHEIVVRGRGDTRADVTLSPYDRLPVKDFVLSWTAAGREPEAALVAHRLTPEGYFSLLVLPPADAEPRARREVVFVIDTSGSMKGGQLETAKAIVSRTLDYLDPDDVFRVLRFSEDSEAMSEEPLRADPGNIRAAKRWIRGLADGGGTEVLRGCRLALDRPAVPGRMRIVHFVTDGLVSNESEILEEVERIRGAARLFPIGIGSSPNRFLLERLADLGRGATAYLRQDATDGAIEFEAERFTRRIHVPVLTDVTIDWNGLPVYDVAPSHLPDLFSGMPLVVHGRFDDSATGEIVIRATRDGHRFARRVPVTLPDTETANGAIAPLWARARIRDLRLGFYAGRVPDDRAEITRLALEHRLLSEYTSFVAVEQQVVNRGGEPRTFRQPAPWPEGVGGAEWYGVLLARKGKKTAVPSARVVTRRRRSRATFPPVDSVPDLHLAYLRSWQRKDGSWRGEGDLVTDVGATALSVLAFRASDRLPTHARDGKRIQAALRFIVGRQRRDGTFGDSRRDGWLIDHCLAVTALIETGVGTRKRYGWMRVRRAVDRIVAAQQPGFGWTRAVGDSCGDTLTTALAVTTLTKARALGYKVPDRAFQNAANFLSLVTDPLTGRVSPYLSPEEPPEDGTAVAAAMLARFSMGESSNFLLSRGGDVLLGVPAPIGDRADPLYLFLGTAAARRMGGGTAANWSAPLTEACRKDMLPTKAGELVGPRGSRVGRSAAMALFGMARQCLVRGDAVFLLR